MKRTGLRNSILWALATTTMATGAWAQTLEEVVVTATKRQVGLQDVPIAIAVVGGEKIAEMGMTELEDVALYMPNVHIAEGGAGTQLFIRGVGSGINYGFEQSVGMFVDGVYYGRGRIARGTFVDLERVEVLKGPQSTLFGKNTIAGAINTTTAAPTDEFESYVELAYETEIEGWGVTAMISGPLSDSVRGRLVAKKWEEDGYVNNTAANGQDGPQEDNTFLRGRLDFDVSDNLSVSLLASYGEFNVDGRQDQISIANPTATFLYQTFGDPNFDANFNYDKNQRNITGFPEFDDTESYVFQMTADYAWGEHTLRSITAFTGYEFENRLDSDYGPLEFLSRGRAEEHDQFTQEFLLTSPTGGKVDYLAGFFYQSEDLTNNRSTLVNFSGLPPVDAGTRALINGALGTNLMAGDIDGDGFSFFDQDTETISVFAEGTFHVSDVFRITAGLRYSDDEKDVEKSGFVASLGSTTPNPFLGLIYGPAVLSLAAEHEYALSRKEDHLTGHINLQWDVSADAMLYLELGNGYKGGGFDEDNGLGILAVAEFEDETVDAIELGAKMTILDGRGRLNAALFRSEFDDLQVSTFDGNAAFVVGNAAQSVVQGFEFDWSIALTDSWTINGSGALLDAEYDSFPDAACNVGQITAWVAAGNPRGTCLQDLSGKPLQFAPDWSANVAAVYTRPVARNMDFGFSVDINATDDVVIPNDLDPNLIQACVCQDQRACFAGCAGRQLAGFGCWQEPDR